MPHLPKNAAFLNNSFIEISQFSKKCSFADLRIPFFRQKLLFHLKISSEKVLNTLLDESVLITI